MKISKIDFVVIFLGFALLLIAWIADVILPPEILVTPLYMIPIALIAFRFSWKAVLLFTAISLIVFTLEASTEHLAISNYLFKELLFFTVCVLSSQFSIHRDKNSRLTDEAQTAKRHQQLFLETISHDLMQPVTAAKMYLEVLSKKNGKTDEKVVEKLKDVINHLMFLVNDLREAAGIERLHMSLHSTNVDLGALVSKSIEEQQVFTKNHILCLYCEQAVYGRWDQDRLKQLFTNLLSNAIKYSPEGGEIKVSIVKQPNSVLISFRDQGIGIPVKSHKQIFHPFTRLATGLSVKGTGLGLYICKAIVDAHMGRIWVKNNKDKGSTFFVRLPLSM